MKEAKVVGLNVVFLNENNVQASAPPVGIQACRLVHLLVWRQAKDIVSTNTEVSLEKRRHTIRCVVSLGGSGAGLLGQRRAGAGVSVLHVCVLHD
jgi:hypothetical protein